MASPAWKSGGGWGKFLCRVLCQKTFHQHLPGKGRQPCPNFPSSDCLTLQPATFTTPHPEESVKLLRPHKPEAADAKSLGNEHDGDTGCIRVLDSTYNIPNCWALLLQLFLDSDLFLFFEQGMFPHSSFTCQVQETQWTFFPHGQ